MLQKENKHFTNEQLISFRQTFAKCLCKKLKKNQQYLEEVTDKQLCEHFDKLSEKQTGPFWVTMAQ